MAPETEMTQKGFIACKGRRILRNPGALFFISISGCEGDFTLIN